MTLAEIEALPVQSLVHPDGAHCYLWVTNNFLPAGLKCLETWGFQYVTCVTWLKDRKGLGQYYRGITEHCLFGRTKKCLPYKLDNGKRCQGVTGFFEAKREHSVKPAKMREMIELVSYEPRIELFARQRYPGWDAWGNEVDEQIEILHGDRMPAHGLQAPPVSAEISPAENGCYHCGYGGNV